MSISPISLARHFRFLCRLWIGIVAGLLMLTAAWAGGSKSTSSAAPKTVHVRQYTRKDGTVVSAHERAAPGTAMPRPTVTRSSATKTPSSPKAAVPAASRVPPGGAVASTKTAPANVAKASTASTLPIRSSDGRIERSAAAKSAFQKSHPCPSTGASTGSCPGYVVDHVKPLACGGADAPANMQWQAAAAAKEKDKTERAGCTTSR